jgi:hypothetical protein
VNLAGKIYGVVAAAVAWFLIGFVVARELAPAPAPAPIPAPAPAPSPPILAPSPPPPPPIVRHTGHLTVSYIEPIHVKPSGIVARHQLAGVDWASMDASFRAYTDGQDELHTLGFDRHYTAADLPLVFIQETGPTGQAPIIPPPIHAPASAQVVVDRVKELRGPP